MKNTITQVNGDLLKALLHGGKIIFAISRYNIWHMAVVEMPKDIDLFPHGNDIKYKYLVFEVPPNGAEWYHASSNNLTKKQNEKKCWDEWANNRVYDPKKHKQ